MTDVTGFGLAGHLVELAEGSNLTAELYYSKVQKIEGVGDYIAQNIGPDATFRNWNGYGHKIDFDSNVDVAEAFKLLPDPQTNGGLLISVAESAKDTVIDLFKQHGLERFIEPIGKLIGKTDKVILVK